MRLAHVQLALTLILYACGSAAGPLDDISWRRLAKGSSGRSASDLGPGAPRFAGARIAHGDFARQGQLGFVVYVFGSNFSCTGTLIAPRVVLTAAHCVYDVTGWTVPDPSAVAVAIGSVNALEGRSHAVQQILIPKYNAFSNFGDLALLELTEPSAAPRAVVPGPAFVTNAAKATVAGWGQNEERVQLTSLRYTRMAIYNATECARLHAIYIQEALPEDHVCFGLDPGKESSCNGDSGGPYIVGKNRQIGLVSYGPGAYECGGVRNLDVGTSTLYWSNWIKNTMAVYNLAGAKAPKRANTVAERQCYQGGQTLARGAAATAGACCDLCRALESCKGWTWKVPQQTCTLVTESLASVGSANCTSGFFA